MKARDCLASLELLRDFVAKYVPYEVYLKNLVIDNIETPNKRLWALRENMGMDEERFAALFDVTLHEYAQFEKTDNPVPIEFLNQVAFKLAISIEWLLCDHPMLPIPRPKIRDTSK